MMFLFFLGVHRLSKSQPSDSESAMQHQLISLLSRQTYFLRSKINIQKLC